MKTIIVGLLAAVFLVACEEPTPGQEKPKKVGVLTGAAVYEFCWDGLTYIEFYKGSGTWGSVKFDKMTGKPMACEK